MQVQPPTVDEAELAYPSSHYTKDQRAWCERYQRETTFEPLMEDYEAGNESFYEAARKSVAWFESWSNDAHLKIGADIPGWESKYN